MVSALFMVRFLARMNQAGPDYPCRELSARIEGVSKKRCRDAGDPDAFI
jgi:hypothetical protein